MNFNAITIAMRLPAGRGWLPLKKLLLVMKLTTLIMIIAMVQASASSYSQQVNLNVNNAPLEKVLKVIKSQTGYVFFYDNKDLQNTNISVQLKNASIDETLSACFKNLPLSFKIINKNIVISHKDESLTQKVIRFFTPPHEVTGTVLGEDGKPIPGVTVMVKGTSNATATDEYGRFRLQAVNDDAILVFNNIALESLEVNVDGKIDLKVALKAKNTQLEEVKVLSNGYEKISPERATGSFGYVSSAEIEKTPAINLMERLQGKVPGVNFDVRKNTINIRGTNTYNGGNASQPLIVIDGFPMIDETAGGQALTEISNTTSSGFAILSRLNPNDIESITFLKDAAAASIWGSRAANGVIVITTKKGRKKETTINFNANVGVSAPADLSQLHTMTSAQYVNLEQELFNKGYITDPANWASYGYYTFNYNPNNSEATEWMFKTQRGTATAAQRDSALAVLSGRSNKKQISEYLLQKAVTQQYNMAISGGGDNGTYYISANSTNDRPVFKSNDAQSYNLTANTTSDFFNKRLNISTGLAYTNNYSKTNQAASTALSNSSLGLRPYDMLVDNSGNSINRYVLYRPEVIDNFTSEGYLPWTYNAIDELNYSNSILKETRIRLNTALNVKILNWIDFTTSGSYQDNISNTGEEDQLNSYNARTLINTYTSIANGKLVYGIPLGGINHLTNASNDDYSVRGQFNVHQTWDNIHQLNLIAGSEIRQTQSTSNGRTLYGFNDDTYTSTYVNPTAYYNTVYPYQMSPGYSDGTITISKERYLSYYSNASYTFLNKYTASGSIRFDNYSAQGVSDQQKAIPLWSSGLKWDVKREDFMQNVKPVNDLSLRLTYGSGGTIPGTGLNTVILNGSNSDTYTGKTYTSISSPANNELTWETTKQLNAGVDMALLDSRILLTFDVYRKRSYGILAQLPYDATYGWSSVLFNAGTLSSHGLEFGLQGAIVQQKNWGWNSSFTFSYNTDVVTDARFTKTSSINLVGSSTPINGYPLDYLFVYRWAGLDNTGNSQIYDHNGNIVSSTTGNSNLTSADLKYAGRTTPPYFGGWSNDFRYESFTLNVQMVYKMGYKFLKYSIGNYPANASTSNPFTGVLGTEADLAYRWRNPGDEAFTNVPGLGASTNSINRYQYSDILVRDASQVRLQQVALSYALPHNIVMHTPFKALSGSISARNLGLIWRANKDGIDPDYVNTTSYNNLPPAKNFVFGINASF
ncbi:TonB-linked outer membrane protein, SusC/RagA family [Mucilaginibacter mallensis]|uniref:TonB-linked outer membrane protein, SusC/RagA family n=2 Tax=Mucilaginibacter mallensis TaxID=652787 RepID=A0A1H2BF02_MUCMA|nr:TonB-linked outer membrane protein, SusC/RagA family [Mucilaginibacter mallensis]